MRLLGLLRLETFVALLLIAVPIVLRVADDRGSISAYHDMTNPGWYYIPLTAAAMMLVTNGFVYASRHVHYAVLGLLLIGVVVFDHDGASRVPHFIAAVGFFVIGLAAATLMISHYLGGATRRGVATLAVVVVLLLAVLAFVTDPPLFWVETAGVWLIAVYYLAHGWWELRRPTDQTEPLTVLERILPGPLYRFLGWLIRPFARVWNWITTQREQAAAQIQRGG